MTITKLDIKYDITKLWDACLVVISRYGWGPTGQINLTHPTYIIDNNKKHFEGVGSLAGTGLKEKSFTVFNEEWRGSYLETVFKSLPYKIGRFRIMRVKSRTCYSVHKDSTMRIHLPLVTNPQALMIFPDEPLVVHLPANGHVWLTDTRKRHTAMNGGLDDRYHLVGALQEK